MVRSGWRRSTVIVVSALLALGLAACGDDDGEEAAPTTTTSAAPRASGTVTIDMVDHAYQVSGSLIAGGTLRISNRGDEFHMLGIGRLREGRTLADLQRVLSEAGPGGGGQETGPTTTAAGGATTTTAARGATTTTAARGATTTTAAGGQGAQEEEQDPTAEIVEEIGLPGGFMSPGESVELTVPNLQPGTYALLCFIPTEGSGAPHFAEGMIGQLEVVAGQAPAPPTADATYRLVPGRAVEGPATLTAGRHTLRFEAGPGSEQLEPTLARLNPGTTFQQLDQAFVELFESEEPPPEGAARNAPGQLLYGGFDLGAVSNFFLTADLRPGNYVIVAEDTDDRDPQAPRRPPREMIAITVR